MKKTILILPLIALAVLVTLAACTPESVATLLKSSIKSGGGLGVAYAVDSSPESIPYLRFAAPIVCEASKGTNVHPAWIIAKLQENAEAQSALNPIAKAVFNTLWGFYTAAWQKYGDKVQNQPILQAALEGVCEAIVENLPPVTSTGFTATDAARAAARKPLPPHLK